nr:replication initiator protein A [uncultured Oscillibacter sp.]
MTQINTQEKARLKNRAFSFAQKEAVTMPETILSDYFYGDESEEFVFFKIPRQLITNPKFKHVSTDAKLLYGMLLDRMSLSAKNGWYNDTGRDKAMKLLAELDTKKGIGLIKRIKQARESPQKSMSSASPPQQRFPNRHRLRRSRLRPFQRSIFPALIILKESRQSLSSLIHPSYPESPPQKVWRWIDTSGEKN